MKVAIEGLSKGYCDYANDPIMNIINIFLFCLKVLKRNKILDLYQFFL